MNYDKFSSQNIVISSRTTSKDLFHQIIGTEIVQDSTAANKKIRDRSMISLIKPKFDNQFFAD